jgi:hypothetical protein
MMEKKYFDWEMAVEQEFNSYLVPEKHKVKYASTTSIMG